MTLYIEFDHISPTPPNFCKNSVILRNISSIPNYLWPGCFRATDVVSRKFIGIYVYRTCPKRPKPRNIKCLKSLDKIKFQKSIRESSQCFKTQRSHPKKDPPQRIYIQYIYTRRPGNAIQTPRFGASCSRLEKLGCAGTSPGGEMTYVASRGWQW